MVLVLLAEKSVFHLARGNGLFHDRVQPPSSGIAQHFQPGAVEGVDAAGIPQALPGSKMAIAGPDWQSDAATQIRWGLGYIQALYGSPCGAWAHEQADGSY